MTTEHGGHTWYGACYFSPVVGGFNPILIMEEDRREELVRIHFWGSPGIFFFWVDLTDRYGMNKVGGWIFV